MITNAKICSSCKHASLDYGTPETRRKADYALTPFDLVLFGASPARWVGRPAKDPDEPPGRHHTLRGLHLAPNAAGANLIPTPETYKSLRLVCPKCGSDHPAATCRKCNTPRVNQPVERPWANTSHSCKAWTEDAKGKGLVPVPRALGETVARIRAALEKDDHAKTLFADSSKLLHVQGNWVGMNDDQNLLVEALIDYAPMEPHELCGTLASIHIVQDASPSAWQGHLIKMGYHIQAALARQLFQAATGEDIRSWLWLLVEAKEPHIIGRRRSTPELDKLANETLERLLERMAFCRKWDLWPTFDPLCSAALPAWSETYLDDWMTQAGAGASGYWALDGVDQARAAHESATTTA